MFPRKDDIGTRCNDVNRRGMKMINPGGSRDVEDMTINQDGSKDEDITKVHNIYSIVVNQTVCCCSM